MLRQDQILSIGLAPDLAALRAGLAGAAADLGYGLCSAALIRGRLVSGKAAVHSLTTAPAAFVEDFWP